MELRLRPLWEGRDVITGVPPDHAGRGSIHYIFQAFPKDCSAFRTGLSPNDVQNMNRITCLIHSVRVGSPGPPNVTDSVTFPVGIATPAALVAP